jgi:hypothetical protein
LRPGPGLRHPGALTALLNGMAAKSISSIRPCGALFDQFSFACAIASRTGHEPAVTRIESKDASYSAGQSLSNGDFWQNRSQPGESPPGLAGTAVSDTIETKSTQVLSAENPSRRTRWGASFAYTFTAQT